MKVGSWKRKKLWQVLTVNRKFFSIFYIVFVLSCSLVLSPFQHRVIMFFPKLLTNLAPSNISLCQCKGQCTCDVIHSAAQCKSERFVQIEARHASKRFIDSREHWRDTQYTFVIALQSNSALPWKNLEKLFRNFQVETIERFLCVYQSRVDLHRGQLIWCSRIALPPSECFGLEFISNQSELYVYCSEAYLKIFRIFENKYISNESSIQRRNSRNSLILEVYLRDFNI